MKYHFGASFEKLSGIVHTVASDRDAAEKIATICTAKGAGRIALAGLPADLTAAIEHRCGDLPLLKEPYDAAALPGLIAEADIGITGITFAIAQTGTMVEISTNDATRLVSGLPRTYIGVFYREDIIDSYQEAGARIRAIVSDHTRNLVISFISGPSRTGDIELKLTLGVHGPEEAHAIIIDRQGDRF